MLRNRITILFCFFLFQFAFSQDNAIHSATNNLTYTEKITKLSAKLEQSLSSNDFESAFRLREQIYLLRDSVRFEKNNLAFSLKEAEFDLEKERLENSILAAELAKHDNAIVQKDRTRQGLFIIIGLLSLIIYGAYRLWRQSKSFSVQLQNKVLSQTQSLKLMNEKLTANNQELKKFSHIASHDIKEPIRNIGSFVKLIKRKLPENQLTSLDPYFTIINNSCNQIYTLIEDIMQYTKLGNIGTVPIEEINLHQLVNSIESNIKSFLVDKNAVIKMQSLPIIHSNKSLLFIILKNLIENGIKYNESDEPTIVISYNLSDYGHELHVKDNGIGISKEYRREIFELFTRLHTRTEYDGTGLGLSIVESCLTKLGGVIHLKSEIDLGSKFTIILPIKEVKIEKPEATVRSISKSA